jgi:hypothetical protein
MTLKYPKPHNANYKIALAIFHHGSPVTLEEGIALHGYTGQQKKYALRSTYQDMVRAGYLIQDGEKYDLADHLKKHFCDLNDKSFTPSLNITPWPYRKPFMPMKIQKRDERISFVTVTG